MGTPDLNGRLAFIQRAEQLKDTLRSAHSSSGRRESTAEHTWRLCLLAMTMQDLLGPLDFERVLKLCVVHDLGEAISGDIPATMQSNAQDKSERERRDLIELSKTLPAPLQAELLALWEEYEHASSLEARVVKALDKIETIVQHNQGANPPGFDHAFNLGYGLQHAAVHPAIAALRALVDEQTRRNAERPSQVAGH
jgi:putative hydrolases of HD superfamily